jgi:aspartyl-tRNA synthetase
MVLNGNEIGGGVYPYLPAALQEKMFAALGMSPEEAQHKFGFLLGAFEYGAPPHGGIAFGLTALCHFGRQRKHPRFYCLPEKQRRPRCNAGCAEHD